MLDADVSPPFYSVESGQQVYEEREIILEKDPTYPQDPVQSQRRRKWDNEVRIRNSQVVKPESTAILQTWYRQLRHGSQQHEGPVSGKYLCHWYKAFPEFYPSPPINGLNFRPQLKYLRSVASDGHHLLGNGVGKRFDGLHSCSVVSGGNVRFEKNGANSKRC